MLRRGGAEILKINSVYALFLRIAWQIHRPIESKYIAHTFLYIIEKKFESS
jgi:hypothetical protein